MLSLSTWQNTLKSAFLARFRSYPFDKRSQRSLTPISVPILQKGRVTKRSRKQLRKTDTLECPLSISRFAPASSIYSAHVISPSPEYFPAFPCLLCCINPVTTPLRPLELITMRILLLASSWLAFTCFSVGCDALPSSNRLAFNESHDPLGACRTLVS